MVWQSVVAAVVVSRSSGCRKFSMETGLNQGNLGSLSYQRLVHPPCYPTPAMQCGYGFLEHTSTKHWSSMSLCYRCTPSLIAACLMIFSSPPNHHSNAYGLLDPDTMPHMPGPRTYGQILTT